MKPRWLPNLDADAHNARVRSQRAQMREQDAAHRIVGTDQVGARAPASAPASVRARAKADAAGATSGDRAGAGAPPVAASAGQHNRRDVCRDGSRAASSPPSSPVADAATRKGAGPLTPPQRRPKSADGPPLYPLVGMCRAAGLPEPVPEYQFHPRRKWRADYFWPLHKAMVEIEGGIWNGGRHTRGAGFKADMEKYNAAALLGIVVLRYAPQQLGQAIADLRVLFAQEVA